MIVDHKNKIHFVYDWIRTGVNHGIDASKQEHVMVDLSTYLYTVSDVRGGAAGHVRR